MVEIQEIPEEAKLSSPSDDDDDVEGPGDSSDKDSGNKHDDNKDEDGWTKLMGDDLVMKVCMVSYFFFFDVACSMFVLPS